MSNMPSEMMRAAELLEVRLDFLQSHTESIAPEEWAGLQPNIRIFIPDWLIELHASYRLSGCVMKTVEPVENLTLYFRFCVPNTLSSIFGDEDLFVLIENGYFPVAEELNGNHWLLKTKDGPDSEMFLFESTSWNRSSEGLERALTFASERLSYAMLSMEIDSDSRHPSNGCMWSRVEREEG